MKLARHGKLLVARSMFAKGSSFLAAAALLHQRKGQDWAVLHLLCQGLETILKSLLLIRDYDRYWPQLKRPLSHNLALIAATTAAEYRLKAPSGALALELRRLDSLYSAHVMKYGGPIDLFIDPATVPTDRVFRRAMAVLRLAKREI
ncbi:MAG: hypothetical protein M5U13_16460 [Thermoanaerobaculia bacterium]|nr:hypothetical protein [Thermoanaerobaculia bacterium]